MNKDLMVRLESLTPKGAWKQGVKAYALDLVEGAEVKLTRENALLELLNGADTWSDYSYGGCACIYDGDIVERLCTPSEIKRFEDGKLNKPNGRETWHDTQARALNQAYLLIKRHL